MTSLNDVMSLGLIVVAVSSSVAAIVNAFIYGKLFRRYDKRINNLLNRIMAKNYTEYNIGEQNRQSIEEIESSNYSTEDQIKDQKILLKKEGLNPQQIQEALENDFSPAEIAAAYEE